MRPGLILQHGDLGPAGIFGEWLAERRIEHETHATWREPLPEHADQYGWIASLGSQHTPGSPDTPAWVDAEIGFLRGALEADVPVLGLCFGGQALAVAAGGDIQRAEPSQIGWVRVETDRPELVPPGPWLHFHYDQLETPSDATIVASSPAGPAAFVLGRSLAVQFHPESTPAIAAEWAHHDVALGPDDAERLASEGAEAAPGAAVAARQLFDAWWSRASAATTAGMGTLSTAPDSAAGEERS